MKKLEEVLSFLSLNWIGRNVSKVRLRLRKKPQRIVFK